MLHLLIKVCHKHNSEIENSLASIYIPVSLMDSQHWHAVVQGPMGPRGAKGPMSGYALKPSGECLRSNCISTPSNERHGEKTFF